jgi:hypothetical protein
VSEWCFLVACRDDVQLDGSPGGYTLATRRVFASRAEADAYAATVATSREPFVVEGRFGQLRFPAGWCAQHLSPTNSR